MDQTQSAHEIPRFYCCYLLRSVPKRQSFYIGSTPNPVRRFRQHNGALTNGSAYRTKREGLRPWEMVACVYGFTSKIAALQFEHAWQHSYHTHFIDDSERIVKNKTGGRSFHHKLGIVRLLLKNQYFQYMDLRVHFFSSEADSVWEANKFSIASSVQKTLSPVTAPVDTTSGSTENCPGACPPANLAQVESLYSAVLQQDEEHMKSYQEALLPGEMSCSVCQRIINYMSDQDELKPLIAFCPSKGCKFVCHLLCLRRIFLDDEQMVYGSRKLIPSGGNCPLCEIPISWPSVVKYSTWLREKKDEIKARPKPKEVK